MNYTLFTVQDFVKDSSFQKWVISPDATNRSFWESWLKQHPEKLAEANEAREIILLLGFQQDTSANEAFIEVWNKIQAQKAERTSSQPANTGRQVHLFRQYQQLAAVLGGLLLISIGAYVYLGLSRQAPRVSYATRFGEVKTIRLPDGSHVLLNGNSAITYAGEWPQEAPREIFLQGEAFFSLVHKDAGGNATFKVQTPALAVEVLGTKFNVNSRRERTQVVLNTGSVQILLINGPKKADLVMRPGELVDYSLPDKKVVKKSVDVELYTSWRKNKLIFNRTPLSQIAETLADNYGYQVTFPSPAVAQRKFTGVIPADNIDLLVTSLTRLYDLKIHKSRKKALEAGKDSGASGGLDPS